MRTANLVTKVYSSYPLTYQSVGNLISGFSVYPGVTTVGIHPRSSVSVYVSHRNPTGSGADLIPLYRLSRKCGDFASPICDTSGAPNYNPFHIGHMYSTDASEVASFTAPPYNYKLDGIEGYVFPKSYSNSPIAGAVRLCRLLDPVRDELVLLPGTGSDGKACNPPFPTYASGSYHSNTLGGTDWIGWVAPNYGGNTPPTVSLTSPSNGTTYSPGVSVTLSAAASDSNGIASVKGFCERRSSGERHQLPVLKDLGAVRSGLIQDLCGGHGQQQHFRTNDLQSGHDSGQLPIADTIVCEQRIRNAVVGLRQLRRCPERCVMDVRPGLGRRPVRDKRERQCVHELQLECTSRRRRQVGFIQGDNNYITAGSPIQNAGAFRPGRRRNERALVELQLSPPAGVRWTATSSG
ncbi:MAG: hypothetical protein IPF73_08470 [Betaproteobacteria bacterium]|nr:hypothetical protein [Betaproteobacteria bacterium]